ncbi:MAG: hypothetical protein CEE41_05150 [Hadesarchaea archaeon B3_Hades]|nr:MAG: hypothetical protein CEE41_05150 [Hadesarchaea archaeon B3_Hades]
MIYFQEFSASAAAGTTDYDEGLRSTAENPKRLLSVLVQVTELPLVSSMLQIWYEKEKIAELPLNLINSPLCTDANTPYGMNMINEVEVGFDIPVGAIVMAAVKAVGGTQTIIGAYRYEITA